MKKQKLGIHTFYLTKKLNLKCDLCLDEDDPYPVGHGVGAGPPEVPVDDDHGDKDAHRVHDECEEQVLQRKSYHQSQGITRCCQTLPFR